MTTTTKTLAGAAFAAALALTTTPAQAQQLTVGAHAERLELSANKSEVLSGVHVEVGRRHGPQFSSKMEVSGPGYDNTFDDDPSGSLMAQGSAGPLIRVTERVDISTRGGYRFVVNGFGAGHVLGASADLRFRCK